MKWKLLLRPEAVEHFTSKHPVTKDELEGILDKPNYIKRISKNRYKFLGRGKSGRYLTIIIEDTGLFYDVITVRPSEKDEKALSEKVKVILMDKANIKTLRDLKRLKVGETYEINEWGLEPEIIEEKDAKLLIKKKQIEIPVSRAVYRKLKGKKVIFKVRNNKKAIDI